jgi:hypothetical protein
LLLEFYRVHAILQDAKLQGAIDRCITTFLPDYSYAELSSSDRSRQVGLLALDAGKVMSRSCHRERAQLAAFAGIAKLLFIRNNTNPPLLSF